ncbi:multiple sugar transport system substrate-binding protein [Paenibacillus endophyticus]|uniref:Multiple sugar transport system substrate-binding protein n=1 Tax=Paenibacillus endophyticus TaxID=1294268 RepID=A0A7W5C9S9_9BACL|nr:extracellular solute-binding protein [Paenibacillus endophyticus]MBB3153767.1 multiple sugar transport system substrate-binding protein [Paenibacillus endophyticus]
MTEKPRRSTFRSRLEDMISALSADIINGKLQPGDFLPSELTLVEQYQLSKNSVRKGLDKLLEQEMIEKVPRIGTRVVGTGASSGITLKFGYYPTLMLEVNLSQLIALFRERFPYIEVKMVPISESLLAANPQEAMERDELDLLTLNTHHFGVALDQGALPGMLEPLQPNAETYPFLLQSFIQAGHVYVQPLTFSPIILCYNKHHFAEKKMPEPDSGWHWSDVQTAAKALTIKHERMGLFFHLQSNNRWPLFLLQNKVVFDRSPEGKLIVDNKRFRDAMQMSLRLFEGLNPEMPHMSENDSDSQLFFLQQKASMIITSYYSLNHLRHAEFEYDLAPLPYLEEARTQLLTIGLSINRSSSNKAAAHTLLHYLVSNEAQQHIRQHSLSIPSSKPVAEWTGKELLNRPSRFHMYRDIIPTFQTYSDMNITLSELEIIKRNFKLYWARLEDFDSAFRKLEDELEAIAFTLD